MCRFLPKTQAHRQSLAHTKHPAPERTIPGRKTFPGVSAVLGLLRIEALPRRIDDTVQRDCVGYSDLDSLLPQGRQRQKPGFSWLKAFHFSSHREE